MYTLCRPMTMYGNIIGPNIITTHLCFGIAFKNSKLAVYKLFPTAFSHPHLQYQKANQYLFISGLSTLTSAVILRRPQITALSVSVVALCVRSSHYKPSLSRGKSITQLYLFWDFIYFPTQLQPSNDNTNYVEVVVL